MTRGRVLRFVALQIVLTLILLVIVVTIADAVMQLRSADDLYRASHRHPPDPFVQVRSESQVDGVNPQGFRGEPISEDKPEKTLRIFVLGGSTMLGVANPYQQSFPAMLQKRLTASLPQVRVEVENAATAWWSTAHTLVDYELRVRRYHPDLVVVVHGINDLYRSFSPPAWASGPYKPDYSHYLGPYARFQGPEPEPLVHAPFWPPSRWLLWKNIREQWLDAPRAYDSRVENVRRLKKVLKERHIESFRSLASFRTNYELLIRAVRADGADIVLGSHPSMYRANLGAAERDLLLFAPVFANEDGFYPDLESMTRGMAQFNETARAIAEEQKIAFVDFAKAIPRTPEFFTDDVHLKAAGNEILAKVFDEWMQAHSGGVTSSR
jgi:lysophospholipase L1-like esterase